VAAQAQPTVQDFKVYPPPNPSTPTSTYYSEYATQGLPGAQMVGGPPGGANATYYRLTVSGTGSTQANIAFDQTDPNVITAVSVDFDFSIGGTVGAGAYADGMGFGLINAVTYGATGPPTDVNGNMPGILAEGSTLRDGTITIGMDTYDNGFHDDGADLNNNSMGVIVGGPTFFFKYNADMGQFGYQSHQDTQSDAFDHLHADITIDPAGAGVTFYVRVTSNQVGNTGDPPGNDPSPANRGGPGTTIVPGSSFTPINGLLVPGVLPYQMRAAFGARTGGATDNHDITNVNIVFTP
jgi:hypothetical protein